MILQCLCLSMMCLCSSLVTIVVQREGWQVYLCKKLIILTISLFYIAIIRDPLDAINVLVYERVD